MNEHFKKYPMPSWLVQERLDRRRAELVQLTDSIARLEQHLEWALEKEAENSDN